MLTKLVSSPNHSTEINSWPHGPVLSWSPGKCRSG